MRSRAVGGNPPGAIGSHADEVGLAGHRVDLHQRALPGKAIWTLVERGGVIARDERWLTAGALVDLDHGIEGGESTAGGDHEAAARALESVPDRALGGVASVHIPIKDLVAVCARVVGPTRPCRNRQQNEAEK